MDIFRQSIFAFLSTIGFAVLFNTPRDSIVKSGFSGAFGWFVYLWVNNLTGSPIAGSFSGAITVGIIGELFARLYRKPATVFIIPGIVPLVPGAGMYYTMLAIIEEKFVDAAYLGSETLFIAASIASGIIISASINRIIKKAERTQVRFARKNAK